MKKASYQHHRFSPQIIQHAVWLYARFTLSYRDVEDLLAAQGLDISNETVRRWFLKFGEPIAGNLKSNRPAPNDIWHLDERSSLSMARAIFCGVPSMVKAKFWISSYNQTETPKLP